MSDTRMDWHHVEHEAFVAIFPGVASVEGVAHDDTLARTREWSLELQPFGVFAVRMIEMAIDPFIAVGAKEWIQIHGDWLLSRFTRYAPEVLDDNVTSVVGGAARRLVIRLDYQGQCGVYGRVAACPDGSVGRIFISYAFVEWTKEWEQIAFKFIDGVKPKWTPAR